MSRLTIVEGNSNNKDNVRAIMVKGEKGEASTIDVSKTDGVATVTVNDNRGTQTVQVRDGELTKENVIDNLTSTLTDQPLSANQGKQLKGLIDIIKTTLEEEISYYDEITYEKKRYNDETDYYIITVPLNDNKGEQINFDLADEGEYFSPLKYAQDNHTTLTINASCFITDTVDSTKSGLPIMINNGEVINNNPMISTGVADNYEYIGFTANRQIKTYKVFSTTAQTMLDDGCKVVFNSYYKLVENGVASDLTNVVTNEPNVVTNPHPRQCIGIKSDKTIIILSCDGRTSINKGLTSAELQTLLIDLGCVEAWNLDGGGSTDTIIKGSKLNRNIDGYGTIDRKNRYVLNVRKNIVSKDIAEVMSKIGEEKQNIIQQIIPYINSIKGSNINDKDLNELIGDYIIGYGNRLINTPTTANNGYFINITHNEEINKKLYNFQMTSSRSDNRLFIRSLVDGVFSEWSELAIRDWITLKKETATESQEIAQTNVYEPIRFRLVGKVGNHLTINDDNDTLIYNDLLGYAHYIEFNANITYYSHSLHDVYLKIKSDTIDNLVIREYSVQQGYNVLNLYGVANITNNAELQLMVYGTQNDIIGRCDFTAKLI